MKKKKTTAAPKSKVDRIRARMETATGKGAEEYRASLQALLDDLEGGESDPDR